MKREERPGITNDLVFGHVMSIKQNCLELLQRIYPELNLKDIEEIIPQYDGNTGFHEKRIRLDVLASDKDGNLFDLEMQTSNSMNLPQRMQYYAVGMNKMTLRPGESYARLRTSRVIFLCTFDPFDQDESVYDFDFYDRKTRTIRFDAGMHIKVLNSKSNKHDLEPKLQSFMNYMNGVVNPADDYIERLQKDIDYYVDSGEWHTDMDKYEANMSEVAHEATEKTITSYIKYRKQHGDSLSTILKTALAMFSEQLTSNEIEKLVKENY